MPETTKAETKPEGRKVFRNASQRSYHLARRDHQPPAETYFVVKPGDVVEPINDAEEAMLSKKGDFRDVAKEAPQIGEKIDGLKKEVLEGREKIKSLEAEKAALQATLDEGVDEEKLAKANARISGLEKENAKLEEQLEAAKKRKS